MAESWTVRGERSNHLALLTLVWIARRLGRRIARLVLAVVAAYFFCAAPAARRASAEYLQRVLDRPPRARDVFRHLHTFACVALDRIYMFDAHAAETFSLSVQGLDAINAYREQGRGAIIMVAHLGSFEILRAMSNRRRDLVIRVLMDRASGAKANAILEAIHPGMAERIIDTSSSDVDRVLKVKAALERGEMVGLMADRYRQGERTADCDFLGASAPLPLSPWLLAGILHAPVLLAFGLYKGGNRYELYCEEFSPELALARATRDSQAREYAQAYAQRLASHARLAPYNWFNFYRFWH